MALGTHDWKNKLLFSEHHLSHAASAFYPSPFEEAAILTMDGVGEWTTTSFIGKLNSVEVLKEISSLILGATVFCLLTTLVLKLIQANTKLWD